MGFVSRVAHCICLTISLILAAHAQGLDANSGVAGSDKESIDMTRRTLLFVENRGQVHDAAGKPRPDVLYMGQSNGLKVTVSAAGMSYQFEKPTSGAPRRQEEILRWDDRIPAPPRSFEVGRIDVQLIGSNPNAKALSSDSAAYFENYYNIPAAPQGIVKVKSWKQITLQDVYPAIDWVIKSNGEGLKYEFLVRPGGDPGRIRLRYLGAETLQQMPDGALQIRGPLGELEEAAPVSFTADGKAVTSRFLLQGNELSFELGEYDQGQQLTIDPPMLWATYYGGAGVEYGTTMTTDAFGNVYLGGETNGTTGLATSGAYQTTVAGSSDAFLVKFSSNGTRQWAT